MTRLTIVPGSIHLEIEYAHPPDRVWTALTDPRAIAEWLMPNDFEPRLGHTFQFRVPQARGWSGIVELSSQRIAAPVRAQMPLHSSDASRR